MRTFGSAVATLSVAFLVAGVVWPHLAGRLLQTLVAVIVVSWVAARAYRSDLPESLVTDTYSPFDAHDVDRPPPSHPSAVRKLAHELRAADDGEAAHRFAIPLAARRIVSSEASRRLAERHALSLSDPSDHPRIRSLLSEPAWALIRPESESPRGYPSGDPVPLIHLDRILEDLESL